MEEGDISKDNSESEEYKNIETTEWFCCIHLQSTRVQHKVSLRLGSLVYRLRAAYFFEKSA